MSQLPAIEVRNLGKRFHIGKLQTEQPGLKDGLVNMVTAPFRRVQSLFQTQLPAFADETLWALRDVSFDVHQGEVMGVIGRNGAGKSTLLKILTGISAPSTGTAIIRGRVGSLLEVGTGFHPELTGRENVFMNGTILGMKNCEIRSRFDEIVAFSGVEKFIDTPVKRYSSGMQVRLAFSVAAHLNPEVLLVDEVLSVGDAEFRRKCMGKMRDVTVAGRTVLLVSHSMPSIQQLCDRAILLEAGEIAEIGHPDKVVETYLKLSLQSNSEIQPNVDLANHPNRRTESPALLRRLRLLDSNDQEQGIISVGDTLTFEITSDTDEHNYENCYVSLSITDERDQRVCKFATNIQTNQMLNLNGVQTFRCTWEDCILAPGAYRVDISLRSSITGGEASERALDHIENALNFQVLPSDIFNTGRTYKEGRMLIWPKGVWQITGAESDGALMLESGLAMSMSNIVS